MPTVVSGHGYSDVHNHAWWCFSCIAPTYIVLTFNMSLLEHVDPGLLHKWVGVVYRNIILHNLFISWIHEIRKKFTHFPLYGRLTVMVLLGWVLGYSSDIQFLPSSTTRHKLSASVNEWLFPLSTQQHCHYQINMQAILCGVDTKVVS